MVTVLPAPPRSGGLSQRMASGRQSLARLRLTGTGCRPRYEARQRESGLPQAVPRCHLSPGSQATVAGVPTQGLPVVSPQNPRSSGHTQLCLCAQLCCLMPSAHLPRPSPLPLSPRVWRRRRGAGQPLGHPAVLCWCARQLLKFVCKPQVSLCSRPRALVTVCLGLCF